MEYLTTLAKVKASLGITDTSKDALLTDFIIQVSAFIESACGGRKFQAIDRTEYYDYPDGNNVFLKNYPIIEPPPATPNADFEIAYRTGTISSPTWVPYTADDYLIYPEEGYVRFISQYGGSVFSPSEGYRALKVNYTGGYLIDWANETDPQMHQLPADLTMLATQLASTLYNDRASGGIKSESTEGQSISYESPSESVLTASQNAVISRYTRYAMGA